MTLEVKDDSALVKPIIKSVTPANLNLIKVNSTATVTVKAGGGKTGTNLLFYKYVVTDPNGAQNTPYYTLNNIYTFVPTMKGEYKVNVYVQSSDNSTINKTYTYTAADDVTEPTTVVVPTTAPQPTTVQPTTAPERLRGDVDDDGDVTVMDSTYLQKSIVGLPDVPALETLDLKICDLDSDGTISVKDATIIQKIVVNLE